MDIKGWKVIFYIFLVTLFFLLSPVTTYASGLADSPWPTYQGNNQHTGMVGPIPYTSWDTRKMYTAEVGLGEVVVGEGGTIYTLTKAADDNGNYFLYALDKSGFVKWRTKLLGSTNIGTGIGVYPLIDKWGSIWIVTRDNLPNPQYAYLTAYDLNGKQRCQYNTLSTTIVNGDDRSTQSASLVVDSKGNIYFSLVEGPSNSELYSVSKDCELNWKVNTTKRSSGSLILSPDESAVYVTGQFVGGFTGPAYARRTKDGSTIWETSINNGWVVPAISEDSSIIFSVGAGPPTNWLLYGIDPRTGSFFWTSTIFSCSCATATKRATTVAIDKRNNAYFASYDTIYSYDSSGNLRWNYQHSSGNDALDVALVSVLDGSEHLYVPSPDGYIYVLYANTGGYIGRYEASTYQLAYNGNHAFYYVDDNYLYTFAPKDLIDLPTESSLITSIVVDIPGDSKDFVTSFKPITFTVKAEMPKRDPGFEVDEGIADNQLQVRLTNGYSVPLKYQSMEGNYSIWKGVYKQSLGVGTMSELKGTIEAIAYNTTTATTTHFAKLPEGFNNTGISVPFSVSLNEPGRYVIKESTAAGKILEVEENMEEGEESLFTVIWGWLGRVFSFNYLIIP